LNGWIFRKGIEVESRRNLNVFDVLGLRAGVRAREKANEVAEYLRRHGPFEPHRLPLEELEYTTMAGLQKSLADRWQDEHVMDKSKAKAEGPMELD